MSRNEEACVDRSWRRRAPMLGVVWALAACLPWGAVAAGPLDYIAKVKTQDTQLTGGISAQSWEGFGGPVAAHGNVLVAGSSGDDSTTTTWSDGVATADSGAVYVIRAPGGNWASYVIDSFLKESSLGSGGAIASGNRFGQAVAFDGTTLAVAAPRTAAGAAGKVYVYRVSSTDGTNATGITYADTLTDSSTAGASNRGYGTALAISGRNLFVGVPRDNASNESTDGSDNNPCSKLKGQLVCPYKESGAVYVYYDASISGDGTGYPASKPNLKLKHRTDARTVNAVALQRFGWALDYDAGALIVGGIGTTGGTSSVASATVYVSSTPANWASATYPITTTNLVRSTPGDAEPEQFGISVAIQGDTAVVGARDESSISEVENTFSISRSGAAYVFHASSSAWSSAAQLRRLKAPDGIRFDAYFGNSVAIQGGRIVVGAPGYDSEATLTASGPGPAQGKVYVFEDTSITPFQTGSAIALAQSIDYTVGTTYYGQSGDSFGQSVLLSTDPSGAARLFIGAGGESSSAWNVHDNPGPGEPGYRSGSVFVFGE